MESCCIMIPDKLGLPLFLRRHKLAMGFLRRKSWFLCLNKVSLLTYAIIHV